MLELLILSASETIPRRHTKSSRVLLVPQGAKGHDTSRHTKRVGIGDSGSGDTYVGWYILRRIYLPEIGGSNLMVHLFLSFSM